MDTSRMLVEEVMSLPSQSGVPMRVLNMLDDPNASAGAIGAVLELEPPLAARVVYFANSPYYALRTPVASPARAVAVVGLETVRALTASAAFGLLRGDEPLPPHFWRHAAATAIASATVAERTGADADAAFTIGLLHDLGAALLFRRRPERWHDVVDSSLSDALEAERAAFGIDHAQLGALALEALRFPHSVVSAVAGHHRRPGSDQPRSVLVLAAAEAVALALGAHRPGEPGGEVEEALQVAGIRATLADAVCLLVESRIRDSLALMI